MSAKKTGKRRARTTRQKTARRRVKRSKTSARRRRPQPKEKHYNPLMVFIMLLYMLKLMDEKQFKRFQRELSPRTRARVKRRRRRR